VSTTIKPKFHHATFRTSRLQEMIDWYAALIGVKVTFQDEHAAWTTNDAANHRIAFLTVPALHDDPEKITHNGLHHTAFEYDSFGDLMSSFDRLRSLNILPAFCLDHGITISLYYQDPEGNYVELQSDNFGNWEASKDWMHSSEDFRSNPIGTFFDAAKVYEVFSGGTPFKELQPEIRAGKYLPEVIPSIGMPA
jgi:catechol 2,3-dioxygenase